MWSPAPCFSLSGFHVLHHFEDDAMREIPLGGKYANGRVAIVDDEDFGLVRGMNWYYHEGYAATHIKVVGGKKKRVQVKMHRLVNRTPEGMDTDHINGDMLDNRRSNLRSVSHRVNMYNRLHPRSDSKTGLQGVSFDRRTRKNPYRARIYTPLGCVFLGQFASAEEAYEAFLRAKEQRDREILVNQNLEYRVTVMAEAA